LLLVVACCCLLLLVVACCCLLLLVVACCCLLLLLRKFCLFIGQVRYGIMGYAYKQALDYCPGLLIPFSRGEPLCS
jgi:hypothetical protein